MSIRKIYLKVMLWTIAILAAMAVFLILFVADRVSDALGVVIASGITLGVLSGMGFVFAIIAEKPWGRKAGLLGMGAVPLSLLCILGGIWFTMISGYRFGGGNTQEWILTGILTFLFLIPAMGFLLGMNVPRGKIVGAAGAVMCGLIFTMVLLNIWEPNRSYDGFDFGDMAMGMIWFSFPILGALIGAGVDKRPWRYLGVVLGLAGIVLYGFVLSKTYSNRDMNLPTLMFCLSFVIAHANVLSLYPLKKIQRVIPIVTFILGGIACGYTYYRVYVWPSSWGKSYTSESENLMLVGASCLAFCGTAASLLLAAINKKTERPKAVYTQVQKMLIACPCCGEKQDLTPGAGRCVKCKLIINTAFEEPKCESCGYSMLMLQSDKCPECGTPAPWANVAPAVPAGLTQG